MADNQHNAHILDQKKHTDKQSCIAAKELQKKKNFLYSPRKKSGTKKSWNFSFASIDTIDGLLVDNQHEKALYLEAKS